MKTIIIDMGFMGKYHDLFLSVLHVSFTSTHYIIKILTQENVSDGSVGNGSTM